MHFNIWVEKKPLLEQDVHLVWQVQLIAVLILVVATILPIDEKIEEVYEVLCLDFDRLVRLLHGFFSQEVPSLLIHHLVDHNLI